VPWPVYTETFIRRSNPPGWYAFEVPAGERAIVKSVQACQTTTTAGDVACKVNGIFICYFTLPATFGQLVQPVLAVARAGWLVEAYVPVSGIHVVVSGYLFADPQGASEDAPEGDWNGAEMFPVDPQPLPAA
jgi:hypothetical protein